MKFLLRKILTAVAVLSVAFAPAAVAADPDPCPSCGSPWAGTDWSSPERIREASRVGSDRSVFWSGSYTNGVSIGTTVDAWARAWGDVTLLNALEDRRLSYPANGDQNPLVFRFWDVASQIYAQEARDTVSVVVGDIIREGTTWERMECPALARNSRVTTVTARHARNPDGITRVLWHRGNTLEQKLRHCNPRTFFP